jgi:hypothetical protein
MNHHHESTPGEKIIEFYLDEQGIKFEREVNIPNLVNDSKSVRRADFYLPKYKVYIEFLGKWADSEIQQDYREKMRVYESNKIPCVYIFPDNLGPLNSVFRMRLTENLEKYGLTRELFLFNFWKLQNILGVVLVACLLLFLLLVASENIFNGNLKIGTLSVLLPAILAIGFLIYSVKLIFFKKKKYY